MVYELLMHSVVSPFELLVSCQNSIRECGNTLCVRRMTQVKNGSHIKHVASILRSFPIAGTGKLLVFVLSLYWVVLLPCWWQGWPLGPPSSKLWTTLPPSLIHC